MAIPASYTEATLKAFLHAEAGDIASVLGWTVDGGSYDEAVNDALVGYGADDVTTITGRDNIAKLRAFARVAVWGWAVKQLSARVNHSADGRSVSRGDYQTMAAKAYQMAIVDALPYRDSYKITATRVYDRHDPYEPIADEDRTL